MITLRFARPEDAPSLSAIIDPLVLTTAINFKDVPSPSRELAMRIAAETHPWIVATDGDRICGYACSMSVNPAAGEAWSVETGIALAADARGQGLGTRLYAALLEVLVAQGFHHAFAAVTLPNPASERLHERLGFRRYGVTERNGWKLGRWHDMSWWQKRLIDDDGDAPPRAIQPLRALGPILPR